MHISFVDVVSGKRLNNSDSARTVVIYGSSDFSRQLRIRTFIVRSVRENLVVRIILRTESGSSEGFSRHIVVTDFQLIVMEVFNIREGCGCYDATEFSSFLQFVVACVRGVIKRNNACCLRVGEAAVFCTYVSRVKSEIFNLIVGGIQIKHIFFSAIKVEFYALKFCICVPVVLLCFASNSVVEHILFNMAVFNLAGF